MRTKRLRFYSLLTSVGLVLSTSITPTYAAQKGNFRIVNQSKDPGRGLGGKTFQHIYDTYLTKENVAFYPNILKFDPEDTAKVIASGYKEETIGFTSGPSEMTFVRPVWIYLFDLPNGEVDITHSLITPIRMTHDMMIRSGDGSHEGDATLNMKASITVENGSTLLLDGKDNPSSEDSTVTFVNETDSSAIVVEDGGTLRVGAVILENQENNVSPFIDLNGGDAIIQGKPTFTVNAKVKDQLPGEDSYGYRPINQKRTEVQTNTTLITASGDANVTIKGGNLDYTGLDGSLVNFENGATGELTLVGGNITTTQGPAFTIPEGVTVVIPEETEVKFTTGENKNAIDLENGSQVSMAGTDVTVGTDGENYIDSNGVAFIESGATDHDGDNLNHTVILPDGSLVQGTTNKKPIVTESEDGTIQVEVPHGGSFTDPDGNVTNMPNGGNVSSTEDQTTVTPNKPSEGGSGSGGGSSSGGGSNVTGPTQEVKNAVYRAYNPNSGEHFYTPYYKEFKHIVSLGWNDEGIACMTESATNGHTLYRVYNPNSGLHHYTLDLNEKNTLVSLGWNDEGVAWYTSKDENDVPVYRLYNLNDGQHHYTMDVKERDALMKLDWTYEGIGYRTSPIKK